MLSWGVVMKHRFALKVLAFLACAFFIFTFAGFTVFDGNTHAGKRKGKKVGPPSHAPAHGYRAKYRYRYYSGAHVYFDVGRKLYFFLDGPNWRFSATLPRHLRPKLGGFVELEMDTDSPFTHFKEHKKKYPTVKLKKKKK